VNISIFEGDITDAPADAICTSTNPRLSLMMGTGGAVRERGGFEVLRACERITGGKLVPAGSAHPTTAGALPYKLAIHCVASDNTHRSSARIVAACVRNALMCAEIAGCKSIAMPVFGTGHAHLKLEQALLTILEVLGAAPSSVKNVLIAIDDAERAAVARGVLAAYGKTPSSSSEAWSSAVSR
jgi:O-acetyl-ADP-ribose deacetylase (regulator of RNase III)